MYLLFIWGGRNDFDVGYIHFEGHWKGWALKIETFWALKWSRCFEVFLFGTRANVSKKSSYNLRISKIIVCLRRRKNRQTKLENPDSRLVWYVLICIYTNTLNKVHAVVEMTQVRNTKIKEIEEQIYEWKRRKVHVKDLLKQETKRTNNIWTRIYAYMKSLCYINRTNYHWRYTFSDKPSDLLNDFFPRMI